MRGAFFGRPLSCLYTLHRSSKGRSPLYVRTRASSPRLFFFFFFHVLNLHSCACMCVPSSAYSLLACLLTSVAIPCFVLRGKKKKNQVPREAADKLIFEEESKEKAKKEAKIAEERAEREKAKKGKVFAHLAGTGGSAPADSAKPPAPPSSEAETAAAAAATGGVEERWVAGRNEEGFVGVWSEGWTGGCVLSCCRVDFFFVCILVSRVETVQEGGGTIARDGLYHPAAGRGVQTFETI